MYNRNTPMQPPQSFEFPFTPYNIQHEFMSNLYKIIENKQIGIFESPTGTGKSLSLTCGALKWLKDHNELVKSEINDKITHLTVDISNSEKDEAVDWISSQFGAIQKKQELCDIKHILDVIVNYEKKIKDIRERKYKEKKKNVWVNKVKSDMEQIKDENAPKDNEENDFIIDDYEEKELEVPEDEKEKSQLVQIFFCSRTHSQLSQVVNEIKNTIYGNTIRVVSLGSRQNYCINTSVRKLNSNALINERCLELQKSKSTPTFVDSVTGKQIKKAKTTQAKCPFYAQNTINSLRETSLTDILDIEELVKAAKNEKACPYYASRLTATDAEVVMLPYQMLLHKRTRIQTGLNIKNSVIIIDEAHNLIDTISNIYSAEITLEQLQKAHQQLLVYKTKYFSRFSSKNLLKINQLIFITNRLVKLLSLEQTKILTRMIFVHELMTEGEFFNLKLNEILDFCEQTQLAQKVHGFSQKFGDVIPVETDKSNMDRKSYLHKLSERQLIKQKKTKPVAKQEIENKNCSVELAKTGSTSSVIRPLLAFLECLMEKSDDGRVLITYNNGLKSKSSMKYLLLNPSSHFEEILNQCRALIVAGGTMQPTAEFTHQLFRSHSERIQQHFFGHVVPKESVLPMAVGKGPTNVKFLFNFTNRNNKDILAELARTLKNVCNVVPAGIVCFFGSYEYMDSFYKYLDESKVLLEIIRKKKVFKEPRNSNQVEKMLLEYSQAAKGNGEGSQNGAFLLSVVGGKLSEGLNFSDNLGRCVIVVGLPFPNKYNPELSEKMKYLDQTCHSTAGAEYYENICMKAVNQCIGRAVRHINDYASVLLLDERYSYSKIYKKLPSWIGEALKFPTTFGMVQSSLAKFFREKNTKL